MRIISLLIVIGLFVSLSSPPTLRMARLKYKGGGDWYTSPTSLPNLAKFCNENLSTNFFIEESIVEVGSKEIFDYSFVHMTGHGNVIFSDEEARNLRNYLIAGGFLNINDSYGLDRFVRIEMKKVFPELNFIELPFTHDIYHQKFDFNSGLPKIHKHDEKPPQGFGLIFEGRLVCFYNYECDLGDGWEDEDVHNDPPEKRLQALQMGANIIQYVFMN
ncbi:MAG: DUF4159 domain-containing protein [Bacteroidetes bacterium]|nr:DUF4159 domain-containing protein [Bacteroidota bacterium]